MKISDFLNRDNVLVDMRVSGKNPLLQELARRAEAAIDVPADVIFAELQKREELGSTGVGGGVALPHARLHGITRPFGLVATLKQPIEFNAIDDQFVDVIFLLLLPAAPQGEQLSALALVARKLKTLSVLEQMRSLKSAPDLYAALTT